MQQFGSVVSVVGIQNISKREKMVFSLYECQCLFISVAILVIPKRPETGKSVSEGVPFSIGVEMPMKNEEIFKSRVFIGCFFLTFSPRRKKDKTNINYSYLQLDDLRQKVVTYWESIVKDTKIFRMASDHYTMFHVFQSPCWHFSGSMVGNWAISGQPKPDINLVC